MPAPPPGFEIDPQAALPPGFAIENEPAVAQDVKPLTFAQQLAREARPYLQGAGGDAAVAQEGAAVEQGVLDRLMPYLEKVIEIYPEAIQVPYKAIGAGAELAATAATGMVAQPVSGLAGLARTITAGPEEGAKTVEQIQEAMTYQPRTEYAQKALGIAAKGVEKAKELPGVKQTLGAASEFQQKVLETAGPGAATATSLIPPVLMELIGLRGSRAAKRAILRKGLEKTDVRQFYNETGTLRNEVKDQLRAANIDLAEVSDVLPEDIITQKRLEPLAQQIKEVKSPLGIGEEARFKKLAETFDPDLAKIKQFEELEVDYLPQYVSQNPSAAAIAENLKDIPGSIMAKRQVDITNEIMQRADDTIIKLGGQPERYVFETGFRKEMDNLIETTAKDASKYYNAVSKEIPGKTQIEPNKMMELIENRITDLGGGKIGESRLEGPIRKIYRQLKKGPSTYYLIDRERRTVGDQLGGMDTTFKNVNRKELSDFYDALTDDQETAILRQGNQDLLQTYLAGKNLTARRKAIENQMANVMGKKLQKDITEKMGNAMRDLAKGDIRSYDEVVKTVPKELDPAVKKGLVATSLRDAFRFNANKSQKYSVGGFGTWWNSVKKNPDAIKRLRADLGEDGMKRIELIAGVNDSLKKTYELSVKTGRQISTPGLFDEVEKISGRIYGIGREKAKRLPFVGRIFGDVIAQPKNARSLAADELLADRKFKNILKQVAANPPTTPVQRANADRMIENLQKVKTWKKQLPPNELEELGVTGITGYLFGQTQPQPAEQMQ